MKYIYTFFSILWLSMVCTNICAQEKDIPRSEVISDSIAIRQYDSLKNDAYDSLKFDLAIEYGQKSLELSEKLLGTAHIKYMRNLYFIAFVNGYGGKGDSKTAQNLYERCMDLATTHLSADHSIVGDIQNDLAGIYADFGQYEKAIEYYHLALDNSAKHYGKKHPYYGITLNNLSRLNGWLGKYALAIEQAKEALRIAEDSLGKRHPVTGIRLNNLAMLYSDLGQFEKEIPLLFAALETVNEKHPNYGFLLHNLAETYSSLGSYDQALEYAIQAKEHTGGIFGKEHPEYPKRLHVLGKIYSSLGEITHAIVELEESVKLTKDYLGSSHPSYAIRLQSLGNAYLYNDEYEKALACYEKGNRIIFEKWGKSHHTYYRSVMSIAQIYELRGDFNKAKPLMREAVNLHMQAMGRTSEGSDMILQQAARIYLKSGDTDSAFVFMEKVRQTIQNDVNDLFPLLTEKGQEDYFKSLRSNFDFQYTFASKYEKEFPQATGLVYNNALTYKGLRLLSAQKMRESIEASESEELKMDYKQWSQSKRILGKQYGLSPEARFYDIDSLEAKIKALETKLALESQAFRKIKETADWEKVQQVLESNEVAIEFIHYDKWNADTAAEDATMYAALVLTEDHKTPIFVHLFEEKELMNLLNLSVYDAAKKVDSLYREELSQLVWKPLAPYLKGKKKIFYSPSGLLHQISLAAIPFNKNKRLLDKYELNYVSSTRELIGKNQSEPEYPKQALIYGGITYDKYPSRLDSKMIAVIDDISPKPEDVIISRNERGRHWYPLPKSREEAISISKIFNSNKIETISLSDTVATEESMKQVGLSNDAPGVIHLSTHGFFFEAPSNDDLKEYAQLRGGRVNFTNAQNPLLRSGLILTGGNVAWKGGKLAQGQEDGILTAYEISNLDLSNTNLVVLSACETGLGDIKDTEGVFGLQRAFKLAGVDNLLLTLWSIQDSDETVAFMETFYQKWLSGLTIREAFNQTQKTMRKKYPDPYYWAGFVLIE